MGSAVPIRWETDGFATIDSYTTSLKDLRFASYHFDLG